MTWLTTWPTHGRPTYAEHDTEGQAIEHAKTQRASGYPATEFELTDQETP